MGKITLITMALVLAGCTTSAHTPRELMSVPSDKVHEYIVVVDIPLAIAYQNVLEKTRLCWRGMFAGEADGDPFDATLGYARVSFSVPGGMLPTYTFAGYDLFPITGSRTRIVGRHSTVTGKWAEINLKGWADGTEAKCWPARTE